MLESMTEFGLQTGIKVFVGVMVWVWVGVLVGVIVTHLPDAPSHVAFSCIWPKEQ